MAPISREIVLQAVETYGLAWTTQDPSLLAQIFTQDCVYVERAFDQKATFRGLAEIVKYWQVQIGGKQSNISFRHVASEMIRDADRPIAVVKWLAEFDNRREHRVGATSDKTYKKVRFCQMAKLVFDENIDNPKICHLEEYSQPMTGPGNQWPGLVASDEELWRRIRQEEPIGNDEEEKNVLVAVASCHFCGAKFPSRTQLHRHLKTTEPTNTFTTTITTTDGDIDPGDRIGNCIPIEPDGDNEKDDVFLWVSFSLGYTSNSHLESTLHQALVSWQDEAIKGEDNCSSTDHQHSNEAIDFDSWTWAVPPDWSVSAVVNVASVKVQETFFLEQQQQQRPSSSRTGKTNGTMLQRLNSILRETGIRIHSIQVVDRPCVQARREFEKYEAFIPWALLQGQYNSDDDGDKNSNNNNCNEQLLEVEDESRTGWSREADENPCRRPLEETMAGKFVDREITKRLRDATRLLRDGGRRDLGHFFDGPRASTEIKIRLRACTMEEPWEQFCRISVSMRQPRPGYVEGILGLLVQHACCSFLDSTTGSTRSDEELVSAALQFTAKNNTECRADPQSTTSTTISEPTFSVPPPSFPTDFVCLLEPALSRYERKAKVQLCGSNASISKEMRNSIDRMECSILRTMESKRDILQKWVQDQWRSTGR